MGNPNEKIVILGINGSPRKGATYHSVLAALEASKTINNVETEFIDLSGKRIMHCIHCDKCITDNVDYCPVFKDDDMYNFYDLYMKADGIIIGSPVYQMNSSGLIQTFMNRTRPLGKYFRTGKFALKVGAGIAVGGMRNGGQELTVNSINNFFLTSGMVLVGGSLHYYNGGTVWSKNSKELSDNRGIQEINIIGRKVAIMAKLLKTGFDNYSEKLNHANLMGFQSEEELQNSLKNIPSE